MASSSKTAQNQMQNQEQNQLQNLLLYLAGQDNRVQELQTALTAARAVGPENGGTGETAKAAFIEDVLKKAGINDIIHIDAEDSRVPAGLRPNLIATIKGRSTRALWLFAHMDVVPEGDLSLWHTDPWKVERNGDTLLGRGVEDNQQALVSMVLLAEGLSHCQIMPELTVKLVFMSDEECGNMKGLDYVLQTRRDLFPDDDLYIVPDGGSPTGTTILIAEKSIYQLKVTVSGIQCHASTPDKGSNALVAASAAILALKQLETAFPEKDELFETPASTFTPTRHELNVAGVNIMPGRDVFWIDCRLLPGLDPKAVLAKATELVQTACADYGCTAVVEEGLLQKASKTAPDAPVVRALADVLSREGKKPELRGIGGGTVAALLRHAGIPACVWSTIAECCHEPNEHSSIANTISDARIFARLALETVK